MEHIPVVELVEYLRQELLPEEEGGGGGDTTTPSTGDHHDDFTNCPRTSQPISAVPLLTVSAIPPVRCPLHDFGGG